MQLRLQLGQLSGFVLSTLIAVLVVATPVYAQVELRRVLGNTPTSNLEFAPYTVGSVIRGGADHLYKLRVAKGDDITITINSMGARAAVFLFDGDGRRIKSFYSDSQQAPSNEFFYTVPKTGDYYLFCYSGPTNHFYSLTIVID
jgi:hypothetical protein